MCKKLSEKLFSLMKKKNFVHASSDRTILPILREIITDSITKDLLGISIPRI